MNRFRGMSFGETWQETVLLFWRYRPMRNIYFWLLGIILVDTLSTVGVYHLKLPANATLVQLFTLLAICLVALCSKLALIVGLFIYVRRFSRLVQLAETKQSFDEIVATGDQISLRAKKIEGG